MVEEYFDRSQVTVTSKRVAVASKTRYRLIGASLSEPHTSKSNSGIFIYIYTYLSYVVP